MSEWRSLADFVGDLHPLAQQVRGDDPRLRAAEMVLRQYGPLTRPEMVNIAALADSMRQRLVVHRISSGAVRMVHETDLHTLPGEPPALLRGGWILETRDPEREHLIAGAGGIGPIASLGGYVIGNQIFFVGLGYPDGIFVGSWRPRWGETDLQAGLPDVDASPLIADLDGHTQLVRDAARFALILGIHLDAEGTPVEVRERTGKTRRRSRGGASPSGWVERRVYLGRIVRSAGAAGAPAEAAGAPAEADARGDDDRILVPTMVRGHLRRQPYGPQSSLRKWIYVERYEARRWISPRPLRIDVTT